MGNDLGDLNLRHSLQTAALRVQLQTEVLVTALILSVHIVGDPPVALCLQNKYLNSEKNISRYYIA